MALTRLELGELYHTKGGTLERRFLGTVLHMSQQIQQGGYSPDLAQQNWASGVIGSDYDNHVVEARKSFEWGLDNNVTLQSSGNFVADSDLDYIVAEYARTFGG